EGVGPLMYRCQAVRRFGGGGGYKRLYAQARFARPFGQADLVLSDEIGLVDDVLEAIPEVVEKRAGPRIELPCEKEGLQVLAALQTFDGAVHVCAFEGIPY